MKLDDLPEYAKKYKTTGYDVKKVNNQFYLYKVEHKWNSDKKYSSTKFLYIGKIDEKEGLIKANTQTDKNVISYLEYGLSNYLFSNYKRAVQRSLFNISGDILIKLFKLGIIQYIFGNVSYEILKSSYLTFNDSKDLYEYFLSSQTVQRRTKIVCEKLKSSIESVFSDVRKRTIFTNSLRNMVAIVSKSKTRIFTLYSDEILEIAKEAGINL